MARTDNLNNFLTDVADAIREKKGTADKIKASDFDNEIASIEAGGVTPSGEINIAENGTYDVTNYASAVVEVASSGGSGKYAPRYISFRDYTGTELNEELANLDTSNLTTAANMFYNCSNVSQLDLSNLNLGNVTSCANMCSNCKKNTKVDMSGWNLGKVTTMASCFSSNTLLSEVISPKTEANKLTSVGGLFSMCSSLKRVDFKDFKISGLTNISSCFRENTSLEYADLSGWSGNLTTASYFVNHCQKLKFLDIRNLTFNAVTDKSNYVFNNIPSNCLIIVKDDEQKNVITNNFYVTLTNVKTVAEYQAEGGV